MASKQNPATYFRNFFAETDKAPYTLWEIEDATDVHIISSDDIIEILTNLANDEGAHQLRRQLMMIDLANGPVLPWLRFLAEARVKTYAASIGR
jgi:hypothetical protein